MDPNIWSELQHHVDLKNIYAKLPFQEFFQLRLVCKDWDQLAANREFLEESFGIPIPKPYFVVTGPSWAPVHGLLAYNKSSNRWNWAPFISLDDRSGHFDIEGLIYSYNSKKESEQQVFNIHTRMFHTLP